MADAESIDGGCRQRGIEQIGDGGQDVDGHDGGWADGPGWNLSGPGHDAGDAAAAVEHGAFPFAQRGCGSSVIAVAEPWTIVGCEDNQCIVFDVVFAKCLDDLADGPVDFHQDIGEESATAAILKVSAGEEWHVDHGVWQVEEEGLLAAAIDEGGSFLGIKAGEFSLVLGSDFGVDDGVIFDERQVRPAFESLFHGQLPDFRVEGPHVIAVGQPEVFVEAVLEWQEGAMMSEVPFAKAGGGVIFLSADFCEGGFVGVDTDAALWSESPLDTDSDVVAAGQQCGS